MQPPWNMYPDLPRGSIGWRMGYGEDYYDKFYKWFSALDSEAMARFVDSYPEPQDWNGFYQMIAEDPWGEDSK